MSGPKKWFIETKPSHKVESYDTKNRMQNPEALFYDEANSDLDLEPT